jgi:hypothetical protein
LELANAGEQIEEIGRVFAKVSSAGEQSTSV